MKPLTLEVFPRIWDTSCSWNHHWAYEHPYATEPVSQYTVEDMGRHKRLTLAEIAAEYHQQDAYNAYWIDRATIAAVRRNEDRLATLHRFATLPSYDQEDQ